jgi:hypothetical protein
VLDTIQVLAKLAARVSLETLLTAVSVELVHSLAEGAVLRVQVGEYVAEACDDPRHQQAREDVDQREAKLLVRQQIPLVCVTARRARDHLNHPKVARAPEVEGRDAVNVVEMGKRGQMRHRLKLPRRAGPQVVDRIHTHAIALSTAPAARRE